MKQHTATSGSQVLEWQPWYSSAKGFTLREGIIVPLDRHFVVYPEGASVDKGADVDEGDLLNTSYQTHLLHFLQFIPLSPKPIWLLDCSKKESKMQKWQGLVRLANLLLFISTNTLCL